MKLRILLIAITLINLSCSKDKNVIEDNSTYNFKGIVLDNENTVLENSLVKLKDISVFTNASGEFEIKDVELTSNSVFITVIKEGYIDGIKTFIEPDKSNNMRTILLKDKLATILGTGGNSVTQFPTGLYFKIDGFITKKDGNAFSGFMYPVIHHISPKDEAFFDIAPGFNEVNNTPYGLVYVKLEDRDKNILDISSGHVATLEFKIDNNDLSTSPLKVSVYNFDQASGLWKYYGKATKEEIAGKWYYKTEISSFKKPWFKLVTE